MTVKIKAKIRARGKLFSNKARRVQREAKAEVEKKIADYAYDQVRERLNVVLQHPTGYYESKIRKHQVGSLWEVDDSGVVYGPWLEDGKNRRKTRFKGYQTFRKVADKVEKESRRIADRILQRRMREM
jgi:hypothetical protein